MTLNAMHHRAKKSVYCALFGMGQLVSYSAGADVNHICWIDHVWIDGKGVRVEFTGGFFGGSIEPRGQFSIKGKLISWPTGQTERGLFLTDGQSALLMGGVENICTISFAVVGGHIGIEASAEVTPTGMSSQSASTFISGEVRDSPSAP